MVHKLAEGLFLNRVTKCYRMAESANVLVMLQWIIFILNTENVWAMCIYACFFKIYFLFNDEYKIEEVEHTFYLGNQIR